VNDMQERKKKHGFMDVLMDGMQHIARLLTAGLMPSISENAESLMKNIEERLLRMERRIVRRITFLLVIGFGAVLLTLALIFYLVESVGWSNATALFAVGMALIVASLLLRSEDGR